MRTLIKNIVIAATAISPIVATIGCEQTVEEKTSTERKSDGTVVKEKDKTTVDSDGNKTRTTEKQVDKSDKVNP